MTLFLTNKIIKTSKKNNNYKFNYNKKKNYLSNINFNYRK